MDLIQEFAERYGREPEYRIEAPGRVNLLGEHTDYNGCPVLPMAIQYNITAYCGSAGTRTGQVEQFRREIRLSNTSSSYEEHTFTIEEEIPPYRSGNWANYVKAGIQTVLTYFLAEGKVITDFSGADILIHGTIPPEAGLSSSSAIVVASALAFLSINNMEIERSILAALLAEGEQYVGTRGGGMDQAVSLFGRAGHAVKIDFNPFGVRPVPIPKGYTFLTADSLVTAAKTREVMDKYNTRTIECRLGVELLKKKFKSVYGDEKVINQLGDLHPDKLGIDNRELHDFLTGSLHPGSYGLKELSELLGISPSEIGEKFCKRRDGSVLSEPGGGYKIFQRVNHILNEWKRVEDSVAALEEGAMDYFGLLMNGSHASCRDLYEISCPELDRLTAVLSAGGAVGARLTGAGFGGCAVALVADTRLEGCISYVTKHYYGEYLHKEINNEESVLFPCKPSRGADVEELAGSSE